ncbi:hypothetical protein V2J09_023171 [Rumex salicifolius]
MAPNSNLRFFGGDVILTTTYLLNRLPSPHLQNKTPFEILFHKTPIYTHLRIFYCRCFASTHPLRPRKFDARSVKCVFLGYQPGTKGYKLYSLETKKVLISRDVVFLETEFLFFTRSFETMPSTDIPLPISQPTPAIYDDLLPLATTPTITTSLPSS